MTEGIVDVFQTVKNLRIQRPAMVQTLVSSRYMVSPLRYVSIYQLIVGYWNVSEAVVVLSHEICH